MGMIWPWPRRNDLVLTVLKILRPVFGFEAQLRCMNRPDGTQEMDLHVPGISFELQTGPCISVRRALQKAICSASSEHPVPVAVTQGCWGSPVVSMSLPDFRWLLSEVVGYWALKANQPTPPGGTNGSK